VEIRSREVTRGPGNIDHDAVDAFGIGRVIGKGGRFARHQCNLVRSDCIVVIGRVKSWRAIVRDVPFQYRNWVSDGGVQQYADGIASGIGYGQVKPAVTIEVCRLDGIRTAGSGKECPTRERA